jgi:hypothetical protein
MIPSEYLLVGLWRFPNGSVHEIGEDRTIACTFTRVLYSLE